MLMGLSSSFFLSWHVLCWQNDNCWGSKALMSLYGSERWFSTPHLSPVKETCLDTFPDLFFCTFHYFIFHFVYYWISVVFSLQDKINPSLVGSGNTKVRHQANRQIKLLTGIKLDFNSSHPQVLPTPPHPSLPHSDLRYQ